MRFFDDLIVKIALWILHGVMAAGTFFVYVQAIVLGLLLAVLASSRLSRCWWL